MGIQINGQTDIISAVDGSLTVSGVDFTSISAGTTSTPSISPTGDSNTGIFFPSADTIAFAEGGVEALRIDSSGRVGIATATMGYQLDVLRQGGETDVARVKGNLGNGFIRFANSNETSHWTLGADGGYPSGSNNNSFILYDRVNGQYRLAVDNSGNLTVNSGNIVIGTSGKGIDFSATSNSAGMTSELLSDYEQGTWTPSVGGNATYNFQGGSYVKVGSKVTAWFDISISTIGTGSQTTISGLPYSCANISSNTYPQGHPGCIGYFTGLALNLTSINIRVDPGNAFFYVTGPTAATTTSGSTQNAMTSGTRFVGALIYVSA